MIYKLLKAGRVEEARAIYRWFAPLLALDVSPKLVQNIKLAETIVGLGTEPVRPPRLPLARVAQGCRGSGAGLAGSFGAGGGRRLRLTARPERSIATGSQRATASCGRGGAPRPPCGATSSAASA